VSRRVDADAHPLLGRDRGPNTRALCDVILRERRHPSGAFVVLGLLRLAKKYGGHGSRRECSCALRRRAQLPPRQTILQHSLDTQPLPHRRAGDTAPRTRTCAVATITLTEKTRREREC